MTEDELREATTVVRDEMRFAFDEQNEMISRLLAVVEDHLARLERLEYHVLGIQPLPPMKTARLDH